MQIINVLLIDVIILLYPLIVRFIHIAHSKNIDKYDNSLLDFSLMSSLYLFYEHSILSNETILILLINIPLLMAFIDKRNLVSVLMGIVLIHIYYLTYHIPYVLLIIEYLIYYIIYVATYYYKFRKHYLTISFIINKIVMTYIMLSYVNFNVVVEAFLLIIFVLISNLILYVFRISDDALNLNITIKEMEKEKRISESLFKITHEIKNPIAVCKTYLDMFDFSNKDHERYIPIIKEEIDKTLYLLQDFLSINKIKINKELLDVNILLNDVASQFDMVMKSKDISFIYEIDDEEIFIEGDYNRLNQVMTNIIKNALEAIDEHKSPCILLSTELNDKNIKIIVSDNGVGMNEEQLSKIKEPFYTTKKNGSGLGVSLSYNIIEAHGGSITYDSKEFIGTKAIITLPIVNI